MRFVLGTSETLELTSSKLAPRSDGVVNLGQSTSFDFGTIYYHTLSQHSTQRDKQNITKVSTDTFKAEWLPDPKTYERKTSTGIIEYGLIAEDCPEEVTFSEDGKIVGINTNALIAYTVGLLKKQDARITILDEQIALLKQK